MTVSMKCLHIRCMCILCSLRQTPAEVEGEQTPAAEATEGEIVAKAEPEGPKTISYSAYKKEQDEKNRANLPVLETRAEDIEADKAKYLQQGYEMYTKPTKGPATVEKKADEDSSSRPKAMHLAELAAQSGQSLRFGNERKPRATRGDERSPTNKGDSEKKAKAPRSHEINLADNAAFPTLQAH